MIQLFVERIPRRVVVAVAILILVSAITIAATPYTDRIKSGFDYCENGIESSIQNYASSVAQGVLKNADKLKDVADMFHGMRTRWPWKNLHLRTIVAHLRSHMAPR
jgi:transposase